MCRHRCFEIQINNQGRGFANEVCKQLHELRGIEQSYICLSPSGERIAHRVSRHSSTKYSPSMLMYNREPVLPIDVNHNLDKDESNYRKTAQKNKNKIMIEDICLQQKLRWMILCY